MNIFVINLDSSKDRLEHISSETDRLKLEFTRISAVNGSLLDAASLSKHYNYSLNRKIYRRPLSLGEIGCYMSHIKCWEKIIRDDLSMALILEDDAELDDHLEVVLTEIENLSESWDIIKLCDPPKKKKHFVLDRLSEHFYLFRYRKIPSRATGYLVSQEGALKLVEARSFFGRPVDDDMQFYWEFNGRVLGVEPSVIWCSPASITSDIDGISNRRNTKTIISQLNAPLLRFIYELKLNYYNWTTKQTKY